MRNDRNILLVLFDLPNTSKKEAAGYRKFRKCLIDEGYLQVQESVYIRTFRNRFSLSAEYRRLRLHTPESGTILVFPMKLKEYRKMIPLLGEAPDFSLLADDFLYL